MILSYRGLRVVQPTGVHFGGALIRAPTIAGTLSRTPLRFLQANGGDMRLYPLAV